MSFLIVKVSTRTKGLWIPVFWAASVLVACLKEVGKGQKNRYFGQPFSQTPKNFYTLISYPPYGSLNLRLSTPNLPDNSSEY